MKLTAKRLRRLIKEELNEMMADPQLSPRYQKTLARAKRIADTIAYQEFLPDRLMQDLSGSTGVPVGDLEDLSNALQLGFFGTRPGMEALEQHGINVDKMVELLQLAHESSMDDLYENQDKSNKLAEKLANMNGVQLKKLKNDKARMQSMAKKFGMSAKQIESEVRGELRGRGK